MSLREELARVDLEKIDEVFDDIFPEDRENRNTREEHEEFMLQEMAVATGQFPVFKEIQARFSTMAPRMLKDGVLTEEQTHGVFIGFTIFALVVASYAEREIPDTIPEKNI